MQTARQTGSRENTGESPHPLPAKVARISYDPAAFAQAFQAIGCLKTGACVVSHPAI
jgi:hypothetical protein